MSWGIPEQMGLCVWRHSTDRLRAVYRVQPAALYPAPLPARKREREETHIKQKSIVCSHSIRKTMHLRMAHSKNLAAMLVCSKLPKSCFTDILCLGQSLKSANSKLGTIRNNNTWWHASYVMSVPTRARSLKFSRVPCFRNGQVVVVLDLLFFLFSLGLPSDEYFSSLPIYTHTALLNCFRDLEHQALCQGFKNRVVKRGHFPKNTKMKLGYTYVHYICKGYIIGVFRSGLNLFWGEGRQSMSVCIGYGLCVARPFFLFLCISRQRSLMRVRCLSLFTSSLIHRFWTQQRISSSQQLNCHNNSGRVPLNRCIAVL